jgi:hypothetical protein
VRAAVITEGLAGTCTQPSRPESGCTAHGAVKSIIAYLSVDLGLPEQTPLFFFYNSFFFTLSLPSRSFFDFLSLYIPPLAFSPPLACDEKLTKKNGGTGTNRTGFLAT